MTQSIPTRQEWTKLRDAAGGSAGLVKNVSVGKLLDDYDKATKGTMGLAKMLAQVRPLNELDRGLKAYRKGLPATKTNLIKLVDDILKTIDANVADGQKLANPVHNLTSHLRSVISNSKAIAVSGDSQAYGKLWSNDIRGAGTGFQMLVRIDKELTPLWTKLLEPLTSGDWDLKGKNVAGTATDPEQIKAKVRAAATRVNFAALTLQKELQKRKVTI
jgi:hypothetical protein